jgi:hypothetical protein
MDFYEVFVKLVNHGKDVGRTCIQLRASSPFMAAVQAEDSLDHRYGEDIMSKTLRVSKITKDEFLYQMAA